MANLSLKNVPDDLYEHLRASADANHRSINGELIHLLERSLKPQRLSASDTLESARKLRASLTGRVFDPEDLDAYKKCGRP